MKKLLIFFFVMLSISCIAQKTNQGSVDFNAYKERNMPDDGVKVVFLAFQLAI